jgi:hypothetical protein
MLCEASYYVSVEVALKAAVHLPKVPSKKKECFVLHAAFGNQYFGETPVANTVACPTDSIYLHKRRSTDGYFLVVFPDFMSVKLLGPSADHALSSAGFDCAQSNFLPSTLTDTLDV